MRIVAETILFYAFAGLAVGAALSVALSRNMVRSAFGLLAVYVFWIYQKYWEGQGIPVGQFSYISAVFAVTVSVALSVSPSGSDIVYSAGTVPVKVAFGSSV